MADAFISYSRADAGFVRKLTGELETRGFDLWVDVKDVPPTAAWLKEITEAIEGADYFLFVISPASLGSEICRLEIRHAVEHQKRMAPLLFRQAPGEQVPPEIAQLQWISFAKDEDFSLAIGLNGEMIARAENRPDPGAPQGVRPVILLIDPRTPDRTTTVLVTDHAHNIRDLAFSPDGRLLVTAGADGRCELWDLATESRAGVFDTEESAAAQAVALSHNKTLAIGSGSAITLFPRGFADRRVRLSGLTAPVQCLAFDPKGKTLASGHVDGRLVVWDVAAGQAVGDPIDTGVAPSMFPMSPQQAEIIALAGEGVLSLAFSPDGKRLVTGDSEGRMVLWDLSVERWIAIARRAANRELTRAERRKFLATTSE